MPSPPIKVIPFAAMVLLAVACDEIPTGDCTAGAASSVTVSVVDGQGSLVPADEVTYAVDDGLEQSCEPLDAEGAEWVCGWDETGWFTIWVDVATETYTEELEVMATADGCHADSAFVDVVVE